jgi:hypothetical protein
MTLHDAKVWGASVENDSAMASDFCTNYSAEWIQAFLAASSLQIGSAATR